MRRLPRCFRRGSSSRVVIRLGIVVLCAGISTCILVNASDTPSADGPRIALSTTEIDLGEVKPVDGLESKIEVRNTGTSTLEIRPIVALCTCVRASVDSLVVKAGKTKSFNIRAMLATYPSNEVKGSVRLRTNDPTQPEVDIRLKGQILPEYLVDVAVVDFGTVKAGKEALQTFMVRQTGDTPLVVERVEASKGLTATVDEILPVEGTTKNAPRQYQVTVKLASNLAPGILNGTVTVFTNIARVPRLDVKVNARVVGLEISVTPKVLAFGTASPGEKLGYFVVEGDELTKLEANSDSAGLKLTVVEEIPAKKFRVEVDTTEALAAGKLVGLVTLHAGNETSTTNTQVRVLGSID